MIELDNTQIKYAKYGLAAIFALHVLGVVMGAYDGGVILQLLVIAGLGLAVAEHFGIVKAKIELCDAHIYKHLENGTMQYCDTKQATHADFEYLGTAKVNCKNVGSCSFS